MSTPTPGAKPKSNGLAVLGGVGIAIAAVLVLAIVGMAVWVGFLFMDHRQDNAAEAARVAAPEAAARQAEAMLGYQFDTVETALPEATNGLTGDLKDEYTKLVNEVIIPSAKEKQLTVKVSVQAKGVIDASPDDVGVLLFLNQVTTSKDNPEASASGSRVRMHMHKEDGVWLASELTPL